MEYRHILLFVIITVLSACSSNNETTTTSSNSATDTSQLKNQIIAQAINISEDEQGELNKEDLALFAEQIGDARIIGLGEQTHGAGSVFKLKAQLIKYLHQQHNFDLFILESGIYDVQKIWQQAKLGNDIKAIAAGNIFYMYAKSTEVTPLLNYISEQANSENPLMLAGFDSQHTGGYSNRGLMQDLENAVKKSTDDWTVEANWLFFSETIQQILDLSTSRLTSTQEQLFWTQLTNIQKTFKSDDNGFWYRITRGLEAQAKRQWKIADNRSEEMGENVKWWAEQYPDKKIIVWAHTWHLTREGNNQINAGNVISDEFGDAYYMVHFTGASGEYLDYVDLQNKNVTPPANNSVEIILNNNVKTNISFVDVGSLSVENDNTAIFSNDYSQTLPAKDWSKYWDGFFFIKEIKPATYQ